MVGIPPKTFEHAHSMMDELIRQNDMQQDTTKGFMDKTFTEAFITDPWLADTWKSFKKPITWCCWSYTRNWSSCSSL